MTRGHQAAGSLPPANSTRGGAAPHALTGALQEGERRCPPSCTHPGPGAGPPSHDEHHTEPSSTRSPNPGSFQHLPTVPKTTGGGGEIQVEETLVLTASTSPTPAPAPPTRTSQKQLTATCSRKGSSSGTRRPQVPSLGGSQHHIWSGARPSQDQSFIHSAVIPEPPRCAPYNTSRRGAGSPSQSFRPAQKEIATNRLGSERTEGRTSLGGGSGQASLRESKVVTER